ncbi:MAG TPA: hypothetical protein VKF82_12460 [Candidatus Eremiobacteraceae bacterium]|nr:hypothetical protein [Candidatus Eremiobacteraceae bacterium]
MRRVRALAYKKRTSESAIIECALWLFFKNTSDGDLLDVMRRAGIARRRRPSSGSGTKRAGSSAD